VYICRAKAPGIDCPAVTNMGIRPTVNGDHVTVEPWLLDFEGDLYGQELTLEIYRYLRPEQKFASLEALRREIIKNAEQTLRYFKEEEKDGEC
jgi:riboflavin kinase/FMN adenylyltransferase